MQCSEVETFNSLQNLSIDWGCKLDSTLIKVIYHEEYFVEMGPDLSLLLTRSK